MRLRGRSALIYGIVLVLSAARIAGQDRSLQRPTAISAKGSWTPTSTPDGQPDVQGIWVNNSVTPFFRPKELAEKAVLTDAELAVFKERAAGSFAVIAIQRPATSCLKRSSRIQRSTEPVGRSATTTSRGRWSLWRSNTARLKSSIRRTVSCLSSVLKDSDGRPRGTRGCEIIRQMAPKTVSPGSAASRMARSRSGSSRAAQTAISRLFRRRGTSCFEARTCTKRESSRSAAGPTLQRRSDPGWVTQSVIGKGPHS